MVIPINNLRWYRNKQNILLEDGLLEMSTSVYSSPIVLGQKSGNITFASDFRQVIKVTLTDAYPF